MVACVINAVPFAVLLRLFGLVGNVVVYVLVCLV